MTEKSIKVAVVGGSVGGLTAAIQLRAIGCNVDVYERSNAAMTNKGGGIVLQDNMISSFQEVLGIDISTMSARTDYLRYFDRSGSVIIDRPSIWLNTSWSTIYSRLFDVFGQERYHRGQQVDGIEQSSECVSLHFASGDSVEADLVIFADGIRSAGRALLSPQTIPKYAGYVGWRGTVPESELSSDTLRQFADAMSYFVGMNTHIIMYPIPGPEGQLKVGERLMNYVWYRNVTEGAELNDLVTDTRGRVGKVAVQAGHVKQQHVDQLLSDAIELLPTQFAEVILKTKQPFIQILRDITVDQMVFGRAVILGDAAFASRPHAAAGAAKAVADAVALSEHLVSAGFDVDLALKNWEPTQLSVGRNLVNRVQQMGARSQFENSWVPGDPIFDFGLPGPDQ
jgi:2,6-dihydroxypyridine 3-monooxygenase